jgi:hypothetical protein
MELTFTITCTDIRWQWQVWRKILGRRSTTMHIAARLAWLALTAQALDWWLSMRQAEALTMNVSLAMYKWVMALWNAEAMSVSDSYQDLLDQQVFCSPPVMHCRCDFIWPASWAVSIFVCQLGPIGCNYAAVKWIRRQMVIEKLTFFEQRWMLWWLGIYIIDDSDVWLNPSRGSSDLLWHWRDKFLNYLSAPGHFAMHVCILWLATAFCTFFWLSIIFVCGQNVPK